MVKVTLDGAVLAQSDKTVFLEGNHYFPGDSANVTLSQSPTTYTCPWKGDATYYNATINGEKVDDIAWSYPHPKEAAKRIAGYVAFDKSKVKFETG